MANHKNIITLGRCLVAASVLVVSQTFAGYVYDLSQTEFRNGKEAAENDMKIMVEDSKVKMSGYGENEGEMIYDGSDQSMLIVDHKRKSYMKLDKKTIDDLAAQLKGAMAQMEEQLANMPPAQRKMMEKMMKDRMPKAAEPKAELSISRTGEKDTVAGYKAEKVELSSPDGVRRELWVTPWTELKGSEEITSSFEGMAEFFESMISAFSQGPMAGMMQNQAQTDWLDQMHKLEGFPVKTREYNAAGKVESETTLTGIEERDIADSEFKAPKGYKRQKMGK